MLEPYYGWLFPEDERRVNIGITYEDETQPDGTVRQEECAGALRAVLGCTLQRPPRGWKTNRGRSRAIPSWESAS